MAVFVYLQNKDILFFISSENEVAMAKSSLCLILAFISGDSTILHEYTCIVYGYAL